MAMHRLLTAVVVGAAAAAAAPWDTPLRLYYSKVNKDVALLPGAPGAGVVNRETYELVDADPVAVVASKQSALADTPLTAYWSASRKDVQVSDWDLAKLNSHGGNYSVLQTLGYIASYDAANTKDTSPLPRNTMVPLYLKYSYGAEDGATSPLNAADLNALYPFGESFKQSHRVGYAGVGSCSHCNFALAGAWPSAGGADCPFKCPSGRKSTYILYRVGQEDRSIPGVNAFVANMVKAGQVLSSFGKAKVTAASSLHITLGYYCCQTTDEIEAIRKVQLAMAPETVNVTFAHPVWRTEGPNKDYTYHYSIINLLDDASNARMEAWIAKLEDAIEAAGVTLNVRRRQQQPFHSTLAVAEGATFPAETALAKVREVVPDGSWTEGNQLPLMDLPPKMKK